MENKNQNMKHGVFVHGTVLSSTATLFDRKDKSGQFVRIRHEIATKPGVIDFEQILDPAKDAGSSLLRLVPYYSRHQLRVP